VSGGWASPDHARVQKGVFSVGNQRSLTCCWNDCEKHAFDMYMCVVHDHAKGLPCDHPEAAHPRYTFCSERHKQYWRYSHISMGNLPPGMRLASG
jgi:hypothetical protein